MSRKAGSSPVRTRKALLESATKEFYEKGFRKASLRDICSNAGVTTGALYFFFDGKDGIFREIISPVLNDLERILTDHYDEPETIDLYDPNSTDDNGFSEKVMNYFFTNKEVCSIIIKNQDYPMVSDFFSRMMGIINDHALTTVNEYLMTHGGKEPLSPETADWYSHMQVNAILKIVAQDLDKETATKQLRIMVCFLKAGYRSFFECK